MTDIHIPSDINEREYAALFKKWNRRKNVSINFADNLDVKAITHLFEFFLNKAPNDFAFFVLGDLAELPDAPLHLLAELFLKGDTGCNVTICLRQDLDEQLIRMCEQTKNQDVAEHYSGSRLRK